MVHPRTLVERSLRRAGAFSRVKLTLHETQTRMRRLRAAARAGRPPPGRRGQVAMFHFARSGSTVLGDMLHRHPDVHWDGEIFNYQWRVWRRRAPSEDLMTRAMRIIRSRMAGPDVCFFGFELNPAQLHLLNLDLGDVIDALETLGVTHFILLERRNLLRKILSSRVAQSRARFHLKRGESARAQRIELPVDELPMAVRAPLLDHLERFDRLRTQTRRTLDDRDTPSLNLCYEDDIAGDPRVAYEKVCRFLDLPVVEQEVALRRTTPEPLPEIVINMAEVRAHLRQTRFAWMLDE